MKHKKRLKAEINNTRFNTKSQKHKTSKTQKKTANKKQKTKYSKKQKTKYTDRVIWKPCLVSQPLLIAFERSTAITRGEGEEEADVSDFRWNACWNNCLCFSCQNNNTTSKHNTQKTTSKNNSKHNIKTKKKRVKRVKNLNT